MLIFKRIISSYHRRKNPIEYWRRCGATIGTNCEFYTNTELGSEPYLISIGDHVRINSGVKLITHDGGVWVLRELKNEYKDIDLFKRIKIGNNVHIGTNSIIMPGVTIGNNCIIGCGAIVTHDIPDNSIAVGVPARVIESLDKYIEKHKDDFVHTKLMSALEKRNYIEKL